MKLSMETVADALELPASTIKRWIRQGRIPIQRSGSEVVFSHSALKKWAITHNISFSLEKEQDHRKKHEFAETLVSAMKRGNVYHHVSGNDSSEALRSAVDCIGYLSPDIIDELYEKLMARERLASTGIGNGIAIPHPRDPISHPPESPVITTCFLERPVVFNAIDDRPVFVFFLLISPAVDLHLHLLSRLSYCIRNKAFVQFLTTHPEAEELYSQVFDCETLLDAGNRS